VTGTERAVRYPTSADTLQELERVVASCPGWAQDKFVVTYQGTDLNFAQASRIVNPPSVSRSSQR